jgi:hypothetical protein
MDTEVRTVKVKSRLHPSQYNRAIVRFLYIKNCMVLSRINENDVLLAAPGSATLYVVLSLFFHKLRQKGTILKDFHVQKVNYLKLHTMSTFITSS